MKSNPTLWSHEWVWAEGVVLLQAPCINLWNTEWNITHKLKIHKMGMSKPFSCELNYNRLKALVHESYITNHVRSNEVKVKHNSKFDKNELIFSIRNNDATPLNLSTNTSEIANQDSCMETLYIIFYGFFFILRQLWAPLIIPIARIHAHSGLKLSLRLSVH